MKVMIQRAALLKPLQIISGVVEKRQTLPILANVLISVKQDNLSLTATDTEMELVGNALPDEVSEEGDITVSARKLLEISRALPENAQITLTLEGDNAVLRAGRSRFLLTTLPAKEFPRSEENSFNTEFSMSQSRLKKLISKVYFAMGQQDVRHYLNGALFEINQNSMNCVATDGHRLAFCAMNEVSQPIDQTKIILPRKSVLELMRLLDANSEENATICIGDNHFRVKTTEFVFTSKLINAQYPDYDKLVPKAIQHTIVASREVLKQALTRVAILCNEKFRGIRLYFEKDLLRIVANNPEQEEAEELVPMEYSGNELEIGFNVAYLLDVLSTITSDKIRWSFNDPNGGVLIEGAEKDDSLYIVMPMRL